MSVEDQLEKIRCNYPLNFISEKMFSHLVGPEWILIRQCMCLIHVSQNTTESQSRIGLNMLLVGVAGTGKTEAVTWNEFHMDCPFVNAEHASKVGLCADARGGEITPGFLPNHSGRVVGIDELDKMKPDDQNGLLQAMEEGRFVVIKGKQCVPFEAEIRAVATCNEIGGKIIKPLVDRFDFIFRVHQSSRQQRATQSGKIVEQFFDPIDRTNAMIVKAYLDWIKDDKTNYIPEEIPGIKKKLADYILTTQTNINTVSYRSLECSMLRIAYSLARFHREQIGVKHMDQAIRLKDSILKNFVGVIR